MKKLYFLLFTFSLAALSYGQTSDLYFSMVGEGSSNNKFIEIYNGTGAAVNLDNYAFPNVSNAPSVAGEYEFWNTFPAGATIADGDVFVIAHGSADASILAEADMTFNFLSNGDDGFALVANDGTWNDANTDGDVDAGEMTGFTILDWIGNWDGDPGSGWDVAGVGSATANHTLTRKTSVCGPNNDWAASAGTDAATSEWVVGAIDSGWDQIGSYTGCVSDPTLTITSPSNGQELASGTTSVDVTIDVQNFVVGNPGAGIDGHIHWTLDSGSGAVAQPMKYDTNAESISVTDGGTYTVYMELVDNSHQPIVPAVNATVTFSVSYPCDLQIGTITTTCDASTSGIDTYTTTLDFTGGGTSQYMIDTGGNGVVGGDDPTSVASGTITITGVNEGVNFTVTFTGDPGNSSCDFTRNITSPACVGAVTCSNVGDIIITEIMQNPSAVADSAGEYFEIYNTTGAPIDMQGWIIKDETSASEMHTISSLVVPANGYVVLGLNSDSGTNGGVPVDYQYDTVSLGNGTDGIIIECSGTTIDEVIWDNGATFPDPAGASMELSTTAMNATDNNDGANWGTATSAFGDGDLGTPGAANDFTLSTNSFDVATFGLYPNPTSTGKVTITTSNSGDVTAVVYDVLGKEVINRAVTNNTLDVSTLNAGLYIVKLTQNGNSVTKKLVVK